MMGMGEKKTKTKRTKPRKNSPFGVPPIPPSTKMEADCFPGVRKHRKQAEPTLGGTGVPGLVGQKKYRVGYGVGS